MKRILVVSGSRADYGLLEWPIKVLRDDPAFRVEVFKIWGASPDITYVETRGALERERPDVMLILGDRHEILDAALAAHLQRVPIAHIGGGDVSLGSYDDAMRDCISRLATLHFCTSAQAEARLWRHGYTGTHLVGNPGIDYIRKAPWRGPRPIDEPYVVVAYYPETIDDTVDLDAVRAAIAGRRAVWITPNPDRGAERIPPGETFSHAEYLNLIAHCDELIGNSSSLLYEAPELGVKTRMIGKRQQGRVVPWGDGRASERIRDILKHTMT